MRKNILITGVPRSGKSTILKKIISSYANKVGFVTNEVRERGERVGFEIETYLGEKSILANINFETNFRVSRYFVNVTNLDNMVQKVSRFDKEDLLFLDEIGQMELFSEKFKQLVGKYLDSDNICIATLSKVYSDSFIEDIKKREDIIIIEINEENRDLKEAFLKKLITKVVKARRYVREPERFSLIGNDVKIKTDHGIRNLSKQGKNWICDCEFFKENKICSHLIALEEYLKSYT